MCNQFTHLKMKKIDKCTKLYLHSHAQRSRLKHAWQQQGTQKYKKYHEDKYL